MKIDPARFFALTATIAATHAAVACTSAPPPVVVVPPEQPSPPVHSPEPVPEAPAAPPTKQPTSVDDSNEPRASTTTLSMGASDDANFDPSKARGQKCAGGAADNLKGSPGTCATLKPPPITVAPSCESFIDSKQQCDATKSWLKPRVAEKVVACHLAKSGTPNVCKFNLVTECVIDSLSSACIDPAAVTTCKSVMNRCGPPSGNYKKLTEDSCVAAVSAVTDQYRAKFVSCISESCRFETCAYHLTTKFAFTSPVKESGASTIFRPRK